jgi:hypothetical protein
MKGSDQNLRLWSVLSIPAYRMLPTSPCAFRLNLNNGLRVCSRDY